MPGELSNIHILISRQEKHASELLQQITVHGGVATCMPLFAIQSLLTESLIPQIILQLKKCDMIICISKNAVELLLPYLKIENTACLDQLWATIGPGTAGYLQQAGVQKVIYPQQSPFDSAALLSTLQKNNIKLKNQYIIVLTGEDGNDLLADELQHVGAEVKITPIYRRVMPHNAALLFHKAINAEPRINIIVITCISSLVNLLAMAQEAGVAIFEMPLLVVSQRIFDFAATAGFKQIYNSNGMSVAAIMSELLASKGKFYATKSKTTI